MKRGRLRGLRAFCTAFCAALCAMLLCLGLFVADYNSRSMRDGARADEAYTELGVLLTPHAEFPVSTEEGMHLLPARVRLVGGVWLAERALAEASVNRLAKQAEK